ncbi:MAG: hypothetical protein ACRDP9_12875 [Kribbellaceae bacterium]
MVASPNRASRLVVAARGCVLLGGVKPSRCPSWGLSVKRHTDHRRSRRPLGGAELLVRGGTGLALRLGIAPIVTGVTVVSLGTSMPELANGIDAARQCSAGLAVGILVGTNLVNLLLVLGLSALISPEQKPAGGSAWKPLRASCCHRRTVQLDTTDRASPVE